MGKGRIKVSLYNRTLKEIDMSDFTAIPEDLFADRRDIVKVQLPEGVEIISNHAFENCRHLEEVIMPSSLREIGSEAFYNCISLKKVSMKDDVIVDRTAFKGCEGLEA